MSSGGTSLSRDESLWIDQVLPWLVFPTISAFATYQMISHFIVSDLDTKVGTHCSPLSLSPTPNLLPYTGIEPLDEHICRIVSFFQVSMEDATLPFFIEFFASFSILATIPYIEGARHGRGRWLSLPLVVGILYQTIPVGLVMPLYWLIFILSGAANVHKQLEGTNLDDFPGFEHIHGESMLVGLSAGYFPFTLLMIIKRKPTLTALWQLFPIYMTLLTRVYRYLFPSTLLGPNTPVIKIIYFFRFLLTAACHLVLWSKHINHLTIKQLVIPSMHPLSASEATLALGVHNFLKWDAASAFLSSMIATLWFAEDIRQVRHLCIWYILATIILGPGAAIAGIFYLRESILEKKRMELLEKRESEREQKSQ